jgi:hypothetical protein
MKEAGPLTSLAELTDASDPLTLLHRPIRLSEAAVGEVLGSGFLTLRGPKAKSFFVWTLQPVSALAAGDQVEVTGRITPVPSGVAEMGLDPRLTEVLQAQPVCIFASALRKK